MQYDTILQLAPYYYILKVDNSVLVKKNMDNIEYTNKLVLGDVKEALKKTQELEDVLHYIIGGIEQGKIE